MTSSLIPDVDLVPSVASRVVTIDVTDMQEGAPAEGHIDFVLPVDLHVPADDKIIRAGSVRVTLADGKGEVRLPTYDPDARMVDGSDDWVILVKKSWSSKGCGHGRGCGCGGAYAIRIPEGTSRISLADLPAVRPLSRREQMYAITGASVTVTEGGSWGASVNLDNGILRLGLTVPPGGTAWYRGLAADGTDLDALDAPGDSGIYRLRPSGGYLNLPPGFDGLEAMVDVHSTGNSGTQTVTAYQTQRVWRRRVNNFMTRPRGWSEWGRLDLNVEQVEDALYGVFNRKPAVPDGTDLNTFNALSMNGVHVLSAANEYVNAPPFQGNRVSAMLVNISTSSGDTWQRVVFRFNGGVYDRYETSYGNFTDWAPAHGGGSGSGSSPDEVRNSAALGNAAAFEGTQFEATGRFSSIMNAQGNAQLMALDNPGSVTELDLGQSAEGRPIRGYRFGDPAKPCVYFLGMQHGNEPMGKEALLAWSRALATEEITDVCVVVVPFLNVDRMNVSRGTARGTDLNRNWDTRTSPEVQAAAKVFEDHDVILLVDCHEGGTSDRTMLGAPYAAAVPGVISHQSQLLLDHLISRLTGSAFPGEIWPGVTEPGSTRYEVGSREKACVLLIESPSLLSTNMYFPNVQTRFLNYINVLGWTLQHFRENLADYVTATDTARA